jgi:hypothetical protein
VQTVSVARGWRAYITADEDEPADAGEFLSSQAL